MLVRGQAGRAPWNMLTPKGNASKAALFKPLPALHAMVVAAAAEVVDVAVLMVLAV